MGITCVPIPYSAGQNFAGLFTIDLPPTVVKGQEFNIIVRRISTRRRKFEKTEQIKLMNAPISHHESQINVKSHAKSNVAKASISQIQSSIKPVPIIPTFEAARIRRIIDNWGYVVGTFQVKIPVSSKDDILPSEEDTLAIFKWRLQSMSPTNRWYPVLERYVSYIAARVDGLGGDSSKVVPSPNGQRRDTVSQHCKSLAFINAVLLAALVTALGTIGGNVALIIAVLLAVSATIWVVQCHPRICSMLRTFVAGAGCGALILAILALFGMYSQMLVSVLAAAIILVAIGVAAGAIRKCF